MGTPLALDSGTTVRGVGDGVPHQWNWALTEAGPEPDDRPMVSRRATRPVAATVEAMSSVLLCH